MSKPSTTTHLHADKPEVSRIAASRPERSIFGDDVNVHWETVAAQQHAAPSGGDGPNSTFQQAHTSSDRLFAERTQSTVGDIVLDRKPLDALRAKAVISAGGSDKLPVRAVTAERGSSPIRRLRSRRLRSAGGDRRRRRVTLCSAPPGLSAAQRRR